MLNTTSNTNIQINYCDEITATAIHKAISPDNMDVPKGTHIRTYVNGVTLEIRVHSERSIGSLVSTLDDLLSCVKAAERTLGV
jgi:hypothetical protein